MRFVAAILAALLVTACQQPAATSPASSPQSSRLSGIGPDEFGSDDHGQMRYFRSEGDAMSKELAVDLLEACYGKIQTQDQPGFQHCLREQMTMAFDDSGQGRAACEHYDALDAYADCMVVGNMVLQMRHQLEDDSPVAADFWTSKDAMVHAMIKTVVIGATANCRAAQSESEVMSCADRWFSERLALPGEYMKRCDANKSSDEREACLGEAVTLQYMRSHMGRISSNSI